MCFVEVVSFAGQNGSGEPHRGPVGECRVRVVGLDQPAITGDAYHVRQWEQHVRVEVLGVLLVGPCDCEQSPQGWRVVGGEGPVIESEVIDKW